ncbi:MAG TPA: hypothetical protein VGM26_15105 [Rhizomicrobium sp.]|jgi:hypothetical protein
MPKKILLQTTIPTTSDDWDIARFHLLSEFLDGQQAADGSKLFQVTARDRDGAAGPDSLLARIDETDFDQVWLFAVDTGTGLSPEDCAAISRFRRRGGGLLVARDHMDLGSSLCSLGGVGLANHFHSKNPESDPLRRRIDDPFTTAILWPNYHSGANGDYQEISPAGDLHPVLRDSTNPQQALRFLPSHPHEGAVSAPTDNATARVIATGRSKITGVDFNIAVAFEPDEENGPAVAQSTFHHFVDYNWDVGSGAPSFVSEPPGRSLAERPEAMTSTKSYMRNLALWLSGLVV